MAFSRDIAHRVKSVQTIAPGAKTATVIGSTVDAAQGSGYEAAAFEIVNGAYTDSTITWVFEDSPDGAVWAAVPNTSLSANPPTYTTNAGQNSNVLIGYEGGQRYVRAHPTVTGATTGAVWGCNVILAFPHHNPAV